MKPSDRLATSEALRPVSRKGAVVATIGDGVNDTPVLVGTTVSVATPDAAQISAVNADHIY